MNICLKIKELRINLNKTQNEFSEEIGISRATLSQIELGKQKPTIDTIENIAIKYNIKYDFFFKELNNPSLDSENIILKEDIITSNVCKSCQDKERIIISKEETIEALKKTVKQLEKNLEFYESNSNSGKKTA
jgi:transcriptional regulator with XRE-family HTH domain